MQNAKCKMQNCFIPLHSIHKEKDLVRNAECGVRKNNAILEELKFELSLVLTESR